MERIKKYWAHYFVLAIVLITAVYVAIKQDDIYITIHDNLDSNIAFLSYLNKNGIYFDYNSTVNILSEQSRTAFGSYLTLYGFFYSFLSPFVAYLTTTALKVIFSMLGFYLLNKQLEIDKDKEINLVVLIGFLYGILPFFSATFGFATLPILLALLIQTYRKPNFWCYLGLLVYPTTTSLFLFGAFILGYMILFLIGDTICKRKVSLPIVAAFFILLFGFIICDYSTLSYLFQAKGIRSSASYTNYSIISILITAAKAFATGQYHSGLSWIAIMGPVCGIAFIKKTYSYIKQKEYKKFLKDPFMLLMYWYTFNSLCVGLNSYALLRNFLAKIMPFSVGFSFSRTLWFSPFAATLAFMMVIVEMKNKPINKVIFAYGCLVLLLFPEIYNDLYKNLWGGVIAPAFGEQADYLTYKEFYAEDLFDKIKEDINYQGEYSVAFGFHTGVLNYNTINTLDGYVSFYNSSYKEVFRELIAPELEIDEVNRSYFDNWGGRAYVFSNEVTYEPTIYFPEEANLQIDMDVFRKLEGVYIFSTVQIANADELGIRIIERYQTEETPYVIYLYCAR